MAVWRRWVFPILFAIVFGALAAALVKMAFFPDTATASADPGGQITEPVVPVVRQSVIDELTLEGTIARDDAVTVRSEVDGAVSEVKVAPGQSVAAGQVLMTIKQSYPAKTIDVLAPEAGEVTAVAVVKGQPTSIGGEIATLSPTRYHVQSTIEPVQLYRLLNAPTEGEVTIQGGPAPFSCTGLSVQVSEDGTTSITCAVTTDQTVFAGLRTELSIRVATVDDALVVPVTAVRGGAGTGLVWVDAGTGAPLEEREVGLGVSDGTVVEVVSGLTDGEQVRQFVPGLAAPNEPVCYDDGMGGQFCEDPGWSW